MKERRAGGGAELPIVGWREWVSLPGLGIPEIRAKIDTGALSSSIQAIRPERFERGGRRMVRFQVRPEPRNPALAVVAEAEVADERSVRSSGGGEELRLVILAELQLAGVRFPIELNLARRDAMGFRMILGREALRGRFLVDPARSYLAGRRAGGPR